MIFEILYFFCFLHNYHELPCLRHDLVRNWKSSLNELHNLIAAYGYDAQDTRAALGTLGVLGVLGVLVSTNIFDPS